MTVTVYIFTGETKCAGCLCTSSSTSNLFSNHIVADIARCVEFFNMGSGCTEPSLTTSLEGKQSVQGCWLGGVQVLRTFSNHIIAEIARCIEFFHMSLGWFACTEPSLTTSLQGVQGTYALVWGSSSTLNPSRTTSLQR